METFIGLGFSIGPLIGGEQSFLLIEILTLIGTIIFIYISNLFLYISGALFTLGGFQLPFYFMGSVMLLTLPFSMKLLPKTENSNLDRGSLGAKVFVIFKIPAVFIICLVVAVSSSAWSVLEPTLVIHMQQVLFVPIYVNFSFIDIFLFIFITYCIIL